MNYCNLWLFVSFLCLNTLHCAVACRAEIKDVGVCLHVYLERDFLSLESLVYSNTKKEDNPHQKQSPLNRQWLEDLELEDYCNKLRDTLTCFETALLDCDNSKDFFEFRHLLHSLDKIHLHLCSTATSRSNQFVDFLRTIECSENARFYERSCHRPNITRNIWNKILRLEVGPDICNSLLTQRSCLLERNLLKRHCRKVTQMETYKEVSSLFLSTWCKVSVGGQNYSQCSKLIPHTYLVILVTIFIIIL